MDPAHVNRQGEAKHSKGHFSSYVQELSQKARGSMLDEDRNTMRRAGTLSRFVSLAESRGVVKRREGRVGGSVGGGFPQGGDHTSSRPILNPYPPPTAHAPNLSRWVGWWWWVSHRAATWAPRSVPRCAPTDWACCSRCLAASVAPPTPPPRRFACATPSTSSASPPPPLLPLRRTRKPPPWPRSTAGRPRSEAWRTGCWRLGASRVWAALNRSLPQPHPN